VNAVSPSHNGGVIYAGTVDGKLRSFDLRTGEELVVWGGDVSMGGGLQVSGIFCLPPGANQTLSPTGGGGIDSSSSSTCKPSSSISLQPLLASFRDSSGGSALRLFDADDLTPLLSCPVLKHPEFSLFSRVSRGILSPDGTHAIAPSSCGRLFSWNASSGEFQIQVGGGGGKRERGRKKSALSPEEVLLAGSFAELGDDYDKTKTDVIVGHLSPVTVCSFTADGSVLASGDSKGGVITWEAQQT